MSDENSLSDTFEIERLYDLYRSGSVTDRGENSDLLLIANAVGTDISPDEFEWLMGAVGVCKTSATNEIPTALKASIPKIF